MFIAIVTEDFNTFTDNNEAEDWEDYTNQTEYPIFYPRVRDLRDYHGGYRQGCFQARNRVLSRQQLTTYPAARRGIFLSIELWRICECY